MSATTGRAVVVEIDGIDVAGQLQTKTLSINNEPVDITTDGDSGWTNTLDAEHGVKRVSISLEGIEKDKTFSDLAFSGAHTPCVVTNAALETYTGDFQFSEYTLGAPTADGKTFTVTMASVGEVVKAAVT